MVPCNIKQKYCNTEIDPQRLQTLVHKTNVAIKFKEITEKLKKKSRNSKDY